MRSKFLTLTLALGLVMGGTACKTMSNRGGSGASAQANATTTLRVVNQRFLDMNVFVLPQTGARLRLGTATGNSSSTMVIPSSVIFGTSQLRFVADPIGGPGASLSQSILVTPGDQVTLTITP
ncbi:MAG: hypothetical protein ACR2GG_10205 [Gemmatimonadaceae bacterium]